MYIGITKTKKPLREVVATCNLPEANPKLDFVKVNEFIDLVPNMFWDTKEEKIVIVDNMEEKIQKIKNLRDRLISESDWTILPDAPFTAAQKKKWKEYRQALRDITKQKGFPENVVFPEKP